MYLLQFFKNIAEEVVDSRSGLGSTRERSAEDYYSIPVVVELDSLAVEASEDTAGVELGIRAVQRDNSSAEGAIDLVGWGHKLAAQAVVPAAEL